MATNGNGNQTGNQSRGGEVYRRSPRPCNHCGLPVAWKLPYRDGDRPVHVDENNQKIGDGSCPAWRYNSSNPSNNSSQVNSTTQTTSTVTPSTQSKKKKISLRRETIFTFYRGIIIFIALVIMIVPFMYIFNGDEMRTRSAIFFQVIFKGFGIINIIIGGYIITNGILKTIEQKRWMRKPIIIGFIIVLLGIFLALTPIRSYELADEYVIIEYT